MFSLEIDHSKALYCDRHEAHWIPRPGSTEKGATCPWCQRDTYWDELETIHDVFLAAVKSAEAKGGQQVPYFGDFAAAIHIPTTIRDMRQWIRRWDQLLGKNVKRGQHDSR